MNDKPKPETRKAAPQERGERLKSALKANLARRKAQMRARAATEDGHAGSGQGEKRED
ncbi:hypothetical protein [Roseovarius ramblicola]|uniref:Uncharacterized protein n=1 Tax=Roseovarius ramblicola TaxID=2022336 RepID=A0ABV5HWQ4_9RHOB